VTLAKNAYGWKEYRGLWGSDSGSSGSDGGSGSGKGEGLLQQTAKRLGKPLASDAYPHLQGQPVYVSLTTIHNRLYGIAATIETVLAGRVLPSHIYVFLSEGACMCVHVSVCRCHACMR